MTNKFISALVVTLEFTFLAIPIFLSILGFINFN